MFILAQQRNGATLEPFFLAVGQFFVKTGKTDFKLGNGLELAFKLEKRALQYFHTRVCFESLFISFLHIQDPAAEVRMKVASITEQVLTLVNKRLGLYRHMDEVVNRYKQSRDTGALNSGRKTLEADHRTLTNEISSLQARLKAEGSDLADKVSDACSHHITKQIGKLDMLFTVFVVSGRGGAEAGRPGEGAGVPLLPGGGAAGGG